ncbi:hypothetical protein Tco_0357473 [Tanacetum coccineum]
MNGVNMKAMQTQINNVKNELRNEMQNSIQASMSNQTNELKNMMASFFQMNTASTSGMGSLPNNTVANPKGELKSITTRSGLVLDGPTSSVPMLIQSINLGEEDERVDETLTDPEHGEYTIKEEKIKESKLIDELDPPRSSDFLPFPECDLVFYEDFSEVDTLPLTNNEDKEFLDYEASRACGFVLRSQELHIFGFILGIRRCQILSPNFHL